LDPLKFQLPPTLHRRKVGDIRFTQNNITATLKIQPDITPLESVYLNVLLLQAVIAHAMSFAWLDYIEEKELQRHFEIKKLPITA